MSLSDLHKYLEEITSDFSQNNAWKESEESIQSKYTIPFLRALGWDNKNLIINQGQEVKTGKKPDVLIQNDFGNKLIVVESKDAFSPDKLDGKYRDKTFEEQLYGYCDGEGLSWGILTNFVEWRIYSVYQKRIYKDKKFAFHKLLWTKADPSYYTDIFSKDGENLFLRLLNKNYLVSAKGKWDVDPIYYLKQDEIKAIFFEDLKRWRASLKGYIKKKYSSDFDEEKIDLLTQRMLDRLIFIDYCSDNNILSQDRLHAILHSKGKIQDELTQILSLMDEKFNSELFSTSEIDILTIDDDVLRPIIFELSNIDFSRLSAHVLGEVYESYLSEINSKKRDVKKSKELAKRKSQGIYYTPEVVVQYMLSQTLEKMLEKCKTPEDILSIKVIDPACGSGSFLIKVFDLFLKHYKRVEDTPLLEFEQRKKILQNNIYGVDIDEKAIEIAKLNLLVSALEDSSHLNLPGRKILPNLKLNIRNGNSLISGEGLEAENLPLFTDNKYGINDLIELRKKFTDEVDPKIQDRLLNEIEMMEIALDKKVNEPLRSYFKKIDIEKPLNYSILFPEIFINGGFDCVITNPPYIDSETMANNKQEELRAFLSKKFETTKGNWDIYIAFIEKCHRILKPNGSLAVITPDKWISKPFGHALREKYLPNIVQIANFGRDIFSDAKVDSIVTIFKRGIRNSSDIEATNFENGKVSWSNKYKKAKIKPPYELDFLFSRNFSLIEKIGQVGTNSLFRCENACATSDAYKLKPFVKNVSNSKFNNKKHLKVINTGTIGKYVSLWGKREMTYLGDKYLSPIVFKDEFFSGFKNTYSAKAEKPKIIIKGLTLLDGSVDLNGEVLPGKTTLVAFSKSTDDLKLTSAIINSKIIQFYIREKYSASSYNGGITFTKDMLNNIPVPAFSDSDRKALIKMVSDRLISDDERSARSIEFEIERKLCELYDLEKSEYKVIVESVEK